MKWQQALIDIGVLMAVPALFFLGTTFLLDGTDSSALLLASGSNGGQEYGMTVKSALDTLKIIDTLKWDIFFNGAPYKSLHEFSVEIPPVVLGRDDPFTLPAELREATAKKLPPHVQ